MEAFNNEYQMGTPHIGQSGQWNSKKYGYHFHPLVQFVQFICEQIYRVINCQIFYKAEKTNVERAALVAQVFDKVSSRGGTSKSNLLTSTFMSPM